jgi:hypothetical protein
LIGGSFPVLLWRLDPVGEILKLTRNRAEPDTTTMESLNAGT